MVQDSIELILKQQLGLDANSVGSRIIARAVEQRQKACQVRDRDAYLTLLQSSPQELNHLIEAVVIPETWFFRDRGPFEYLQQYVKQPPIRDRLLFPCNPLRLLSVPCSTGEEPYSIAIALLEAGLSPSQFQVDAVDISQQALLKAQQGVYSKKSFRGSKVFNLEQYFDSTATGCQVKPIVCKSVHFIHGNALKPHFLQGKQYDAIFCRNLLIYLDEAARKQVMTSLDQALPPLGLMFLGAVETQQLAHHPYRAIDYASAFAFQKQPVSSDLGTMTPPKSESQKNKLSSVPQSQSNPTLSKPTALEGLGDRQTSATPTPLETAKQLADRGQLASAANLCESYVRVHPSQACGYLLLGEIYQGLNQPKQAEQCFQKAIYLDPDSFEALIHLALLKQQQGHLAASERLRKRAQRLVH